MALYHSPRIVTDGLTLCLDAANPRSYPGTGSTWFDVSGNGNNGTLTNAPGYGVSDAAAFSFNGVDQDVVLPSTTMLSSGATVSGWMTIPDWTTAKTSKGRVFIRGTSTFLNMIAIYNGGYSFETATNSNPYEIANRTTGNVTSSSIAANAWFNLVIVFDDGVFTGYINSVQTGTAAIANNLVFNNIGSGSGFSTSYPEYFKGRIALFSVYNRALSQSEVSQNYDAMRVRFGL